MPRHRNLCAMNCFLFGGVLTSSAKQSSIAGDCATAGTYTPLLKKYLELAKISNLNITPQTSRNIPYSKRRKLRPALEMSILAGS